jgi:hypothetical protein
VASRASIALRRTITVAIDQAATSQSLGAMAGQIARAERDRLISDGTFPPGYQTYVDGRPGGDEGTVKVPGGAILYIFDRLAEAVKYALIYAREISVRGHGRDRMSGAYAAAWIVLVDNAQIAEADIVQIRQGAAVTIVNPAPYSRRLEQVYGVRYGRDRYITTELVRKALRTRYPTISAARTFVRLAAAETPHGWVVPYVRKTPYGHQARHRGGRAEEITYPAISLKQQS